jgi:hypothetical protein
MVSAACGRNAGILSATFKSCALARFNAAAFARELLSAEKLNMERPRFGAGENPKCYPDETDPQPSGCKSPYCEPPWCKNCGNQKTPQSPDDAGAERG